MRLIQFVHSNGNRHVAVVTSPDVCRPVLNISNVHELASRAISNGTTIAKEVDRALLGPDEDYAAIVDQGRLLAPLDHPDPAHMFITGTGLTHLGSAQARDQMHKATQVQETELTDTLKMFKWGIEAGRPASGIVGVQPEWFYKGDGSIVVAPGKPIPSPAFALDAGEEPEIVGLYLIGDDARPYRIGFALANEFSDHIMERQNYLYLSHSKLRYCSFGPELLLGPLPKTLAGVSRIERDGHTVWQSDFVSGEDNMTHTLENLEYHHFKYRQFLRPGDVHMHFFGTATVSIADGFSTLPGDVMELQIESFGRALRNSIDTSEIPIQPGCVREL